jgi:hypothetical protein
MSINVIGVNKWSERTGLRARSKSLFETWKRSEPMMASIAFAMVNAHVVGSSPTEERNDDASVG